MRIMTKIQYDYFVELFNLIKKIDINVSEPLNAHINVDDKEHEIIIINNNSSKMALVDVRVKNDGIVEISVSCHIKSPDSTNSHPVKLIGYFWNNTYVMRVLKDDPFGEKTKEVLTKNLEEFFNNQNI